MGAPWPPCSSTGTRSPWPRWGLPRVPALQSGAPAGHHGPHLRAAPHRRGPLRPRRPTHPHDVPDARARGRGRLPRSSRSAPCAPPWASAGCCVDRLLVRGQRQGVGSVMRSTGDLRPDRELAAWS
ncbi:hypothetical protein QJS66_11635 [Kocuria rhizophila]|nr:hypothetical protein QJS66_11635 [Kocuria rhizophila]